MERGSKQQLWSDTASLPPPLQMHLLASQNCTKMGKNALLRHRVEPLSICACIMQGSPHIENSDLGGQGLGGQALRRYPHPPQLALPKGTETVIGVTCPGGSRAGADGGGRGGRWCEGHWRYWVGARGGAGMQVRARFRDCARGKGAGVGSGAGQAWLGIAQEGLCCVLADVG